MISLIVSAGILAVIHFSRRPDDHWFWVMIGLGRKKWKLYEEVELPLTWLAIHTSILLLIGIISSIYGFIGKFLLNRWIKKWEEKDIVVGNAVLGEPVVEEPVERSALFGGGYNKVSDIEITTATKMDVTDTS